MEVQASPVSALYVHVPFCASKCRYCDFFSVPLDRAWAGQYVRAVEAELAGRCQCLARPVGSVFVGGGTPTVLGPELLGQLLRAVGPFLGRETEFTVEANPGTVSRDMAELLAAGGVNRVSMGAQSFAGDELATLGRMHTPGEIEQAITLLRQAGITNLSLDLIYGIPGQDRRSWHRSVARAIDLQPAHLSIYGLTFEKDTPLWRDLQAGLTAELDDESQREYYYDAIQMATTAGFEHYELSNLAMPDRRCEHNITYWRNLPYLGIGPGAASYVDGVRRTNKPDLPGYVEAIRAGGLPPAEAERLTGRRAMAEALMLGLRLADGVNRRDFRLRYGQDPLDAFAMSIGQHQRLGSVKVTADSISISHDYLFVSNSIIGDIFKAVE